MSRAAPARVASVRRRLTSLLALALAVTSACSAFGAAPAVTIDGDEISVDSLTEEVDTIRGNEAYVQNLESNFGSPASGSSEGTFNAAFVAQLLSLRIYYTLIENDLRENGQLDELDAAVTEFEQSIPADFDAAFGEGSFAKFPRSYRADLIRQQALFQVLQRAVENEVGTDEREFFDAHERDFDEICVSHALVGVQTGRTDAEARSAADDLYDRIQDGEDFVDIATHESDDPGASAGGGELGCGNRFTLQFDPVFEDAAFAAEVDEVTEPVKTQFGYHLILVTSRDDASFADVEDMIPSAMQATAQEAFRKRLFDVMCAADVDVNPRYGTWTVDEQCVEGSQELPRVEPPEGPRTTADEGLEFEL